MRLAHRLQLALEVGPLEHADAEPEAIAGALCSAGTTRALFTLSAAITATALAKAPAPAVRPNAVNPKSASTQAGEASAVALYCQQRPTAFGYTFQDDMCRFEGAGIKSGAGFDEVDAMRRAAGAVFVTHVRVSGCVDGE